MPERWGPPHALAPQAQRAERALLRCAARQEGAGGYDDAGWGARRGDDPGAAEPLSGFEPGGDAQEGGGYDEAHPDDGEPSSTHTVLLPASGACLLAACGWQRPSPRPVPLLRARRITG